MRRSAKPRPASMTDAELVEAAQPTRWERRLFPMGCTIAVAAGLAMFAAVAYPAWRRPTPENVFGYGCGGLWAGGFVMLFTFLPLFALLERRRNRYWRELGRRYGRFEKAEVLAGLAAEGESGPDLVVLVNGTALPHGGSWGVMLRLFASEARATVRYRTLRDVVAPVDKTGQVQFSSGEAPLTAEEADQVRSLAAGPFPGRFGRDIDSTVKDGTPAELVVWRRGAGVVGRGRCNLSGIPPKKEQLPLVRLIRLASALGRKVPAPALLSASFDPYHGEIRLEEV